MAPGAAAVSSAADPVVDGDEIADVDPEVLESATEGDEVTLVVRMDDIEEPEETFGALDSGASVADLRQSAMADQEPVVDYAERTSGVAVENQLWIANAVILTVDTSQADVEEIAAIDGVDALHEDFEVETLQTEGDDGEENASAFTYGLEQANVADAWANTRGEGASVAVLDTGVNGDHPDIDVEGFAGVNDNGEFVEYDAADAYDTAEHGTHVSGTVVGTNESGEHVGVAPEADLYHGLVLPGGSGDFSDVLAGMEWAVEQDVDVVSMSLGAPGTYTPEFVEPVQNAREQGTVVVAASGNVGPETTSSPGNVPGVVTVGATDRDERISHFSTGGEVNASRYNDTDEDYLTPDIAAPGTGVTSAVPGGEWDEKSGTSMAAPHVAGVFALVASADDGGDDLTTVESREDVVIDTARGTDVSANEPADRYGEGVLDAEAAVAAASGAAVTGTVTDSDSEPIPGVSVTAGDVSTTTDANGSYTVDLVAGGDVNVTVDAEQYGTETTQVSVPDDGAVTVDETFGVAPVYAFSMEADETYTLGIPVETDDTVADILAKENGEVANGSVHAYNASADAWETPERNESLSALDALVVSPNEELTATVDFSTESASLPAATELETGWNFVAAPERAAAEDAFGVGTADPARSTDTYGEAPSVMVQSEGTEGDGVSTFSTEDDALSPFAGYFLYAEEEGELAGTAASDGSLGDVNADLGIETETLEGTVVDTEGDGIENATVEVNGAPLASGTAADGSFAIDHIAADTESVDVTVDAEGYAARTTSLDTFEASEVELRPESATYHVERFDAEIVNETLVIEGDVTNVGAEDGNKSVALSDSAGAIADRSIPVGTFELGTDETASVSEQFDLNVSDDYEGELAVTVSLFTEDDFATTVATGETTEDNNTTRTATATGTIEGPNDPVEGVTVEQTNAPDGQTLTAADGGEHVAETDASGEFELDLVFNESGEATVEASGQGLEPQTETVTESELSAASGLELFENVTFEAATEINVTQAETNTSTEDPALVGEELNVTADAANAGETDAESQPVELLIDGEVVDETTVAIEGDNTTEVEFVHTATASDVNAENVTIRSYTDSAETDLFVEAEEQDDGTETRTENVSGTIEGPNGPVEGVTVTQQADGSSAALIATENESELPEATTNASGAFELELVFNDTDEVTVEAGGQGLEPQTENVSTGQFEEAGTLSASGVELFENVTFAAATEINVTQAETNTSTEDPALVGEDVNVTATVENVGEEDAESQPVKLLDSEGAVVDETTVAVDAGNTTAVTFDYTAAESDVDAENLTVRTYVDDADANLSVETDPDAPEALNATVADETPSEVTVEFDSNVTLAAGNASGFEVSGDETAYGFAGEEATVDNETVTLLLDRAIEPDTNVTVAYNAEYENVRDAESETLATDFAIDADNEVEAVESVELVDVTIDGDRMDLTFSEPVTGSADGFTLDGPAATIEGEAGTSTASEGSETLALALSREIQPGEDTPELSYDESAGDIAGSSGAFELDDPVRATVDADTQYLERAVALLPQDEDAAGRTEILVEFSENVTIEAASEDNPDLGFLLDDPSGVSIADAREADIDGDEVATTNTASTSDAWVFTLDGEIVEGDVPELSYDAEQGSATINNTSASTTATEDLGTFVRADVVREAERPNPEYAVVPEDTRDEIRLTMTESVEDRSGDTALADDFSLSGDSMPAVDTAEVEGDSVVLTLVSTVDPSDAPTVSYQGASDDGTASLFGTESEQYADQFDVTPSFAGVEPAVESASVRPVPDGETRDEMLMRFSTPVDVMTASSDDEAPAPGFNLNGTNVELTGVSQADLSDDALDTYDEFDGDDAWVLTGDRAFDEDADGEFTVEFDATEGHVETRHGDSLGDTTEPVVWDEGPPSAENATITNETRDQVRITMSDRVQVRGGDVDPTSFSLELANRDTDQLIDPDGSVTVTDDNSTVVVDLQEEAKATWEPTVSYQRPDNGGYFETVEDGTVIESYTVDVDVSIDAQPAPEVTNVTLTDGNAVQLRFNQSVEVTQQNFNPFTVTNETGSLQDFQTTGEGELTTSEVENDTIVLETSGQLQPEEEPVVTYTAGDAEPVTNEDGIPVADFEESFENPYEAPQLTSAATNTEGDVLLLEFDTEMAPEGSSGFTITTTGADSAPVVQALNTSGSEGATVALDVDPAFEANGTYTLAFEQGDQEIVDENGLEAAAFEDIDITNDVENTTSQTGSLAASPIEVTP